MGGTAVGQAPVQPWRPQEASPLAGVRNVPGAGHPDTAFLCTTVGGFGQSRVLGAHMEASCGERCEGLALILLGMGLWEPLSPSQAMTIRSTSL